MGVISANSSPLPQAGESIKTRPTETVTARKGHYEPIATSFKRGGFAYRQIAREEDVAIYEQRLIELDGELSENRAYEVVRIQWQKAHTFPNGKSYPAREAYPPSESWGTSGWTFTDKDRAFVKLRTSTSEVDDGKTTT
jgi:hypothetical protein